MSSCGARRILSIRAGPGRSAANAAGLAAARVAAATDPEMKERRDTMGDSRAFDPRAPATYHPQDARPVRGKRSAVNYVKSAPSQELA
jgi:hypothetical protein